MSSTSRPDSVLVRPRAHAGRSDIAFVATNRVAFASRDAARRAGIRVLDGGSNGSPFLMKKYVIDRVAHVLGLDETGLSKRLDLSVGALRSFKRRGHMPLYVKLSLAALLAGIDPEAMLMDLPKIEAEGDNERQ